MPARAFPLGAASEAEHPISQVSNATLGSAAVAYPQASFASTPKTPKGAMAAVLGGVICGLLVVGGAGVVAYQKGYFKPAAAVVPVTAARHPTTQAPTTQPPAAIASESIPPPHPIPAALPQPSTSTAVAVTPAPSASAPAAPEASGKHAAATSSTKATSHPSESATSSKPASKPAGKSTDYGF